jgi:hypothetical protein
MVEQPTEDGRAEELLRARQAEGDPVGMVGAVTALALAALASVCLIATERGNAFDSNAAAFADYSAQMISPHFDN